ncbi:MAG: prepilin-type N-terminal cleavage/methylation domain-containing protein [Terriglobia bacterium]
MSSRKDPVQGGFTLMELLVSLTIMSLLAVAIHYGFRIGLRAWERGDQRVSRLSALNTAADLLNRQLASMVPYYSRQNIDETPYELLVYQGTDVGIRFVSTFSADGRGSAGLRLVEYLSIPEEGGTTYSFLINETPFQDDESLGATLVSRLEKKEDGSVLPEFLPIQPTKTSIHLLEGLESVKFAYFEIPKKARASFDSSFRPRGSYLPAAVELKFHWKETEISAQRNLSVYVPIRTSSS